MRTPLYSGFYFAATANPRSPWSWVTCKEYAGARVAKKRKSKKNKIIAIYYGGRDISSKYSNLEKHLNKISVQFGVKDQIKVTQVTGNQACLRVQVPNEWSDNRITAHLLLTYIRKYLGNSTYDTSHLSTSSKLVKYAKRLGLRRFNVQMRKINKNNRLLGIVHAKNKMNKSSRSKIYKAIA